MDDNEDIVEWQKRMIGITDGVLEYETPILINIIFDSLAKGERFDNSWYRINNIKPLSQPQLNQITPIINHYTEQLKINGVNHGVVLNKEGRELILTHGSYSEYLKYKKLEKELTFSGVVRNYWWFLVSLFGIGVAIGKLLI